MFDRFDHYLSYGATDQQTVLALAGSYDGLIVPGTVAAFQREGTGGFVLSLSATQNNPRYVIDPRFPLFQQALPDPKKSHEALAALLGTPELVRPTPPVPSDFDDAVLDSIAASWVGFNAGYGRHQSAKFDKYADRLGEPVDQTDAKPPAYVLAPYFIADSPADAWWPKSARMFQSAAAASTSLEVVRVVACKRPQQLAALLESVDDPRFAIWVSGLEELEIDPLALASYGLAIRAADARGQTCFALYGGFFSVLLNGIGLSGSSHGIGYGEYRNWLELPQSGPPPARYYLPRAHRYIAQDLAYQMWVRDPRLTECPCPVCRGGAPLLDYHELMQHSVHCRSREIAEWRDVSPKTAAARLAADGVDFERDLAAARLPAPLQRAAERSYDHLNRWSRALALIDRA